MNEEVFDGVSSVDGVGVEYVSDYELGRRGRREQEEEEAEEEENEIGALRYVIGGVGIAACGCGHSICGAASSATCRHGKRPSCSLAADQ